MSTVEEGVCNDHLDDVENEDLLEYDVHHMKEYTLEKSSSSFNFDDLESFVIGPITSRFWMLRKHILLINKNKIEQEMPFFAWECITLQVAGRPDVYLTIKNEKIMMKFIKLLIYKLRTIDGLRGTMEPLLERCFRERTKNMK